jgi:hypothetical protein
MQRNGITRFEKCKSSEMVTINVKVEGSLGSTWLLAGLLIRGLNTDVYVSMAVLVKSGISV